MSKLLVATHPSAAEFQGLATRAIGDTAVPGPETQVYEQVPTNGLYFRQSGRLLTPHPEGNLVERVRAGYQLGKLFELQRVGAVTRQEAQIDTHRRINPVYALGPSAVSRYVAMRWIDEEGLHQVTPQYSKEGDPLSVTVQSWLDGVVMEADFLRDPTGTCNQKVRSADIEDPALGFVQAAVSAYQAIASTTV